MFILSTLLLTIRDFVMENFLEDDNICLHCSYLLLKGILVCIRRSYDDFLYTHQKIVKFGFRIYSSQCERNKNSELKKRLLELAKDINKGS